MHFRTSHSKVTMCSCQVERVDWDCAPFGVNPASQVNANECGVLCARLLICGPWAARHRDKFVKYQNFVKLNWRRSLRRDIWEHAVSTSSATLATDVWRHFKHYTVLTLLAQHSKAPSLFTCRRTLYSYLYSVPAQFPLCISASRTGTGYCTFVIQRVGMFLRYFRACIRLIVFLINLTCVLWLDFWGFVDYSIRVRGGEKKTGKRKECSILLFLCIWARHAMLAHASVRSHIHCWSRNTNSRS